VRAAMELLAASGVLLDSAARRARDHGIEAHQSLDPSRILVDRDGEVSLLGYGIPDMEATSFLDTGEHRPERVVYWPPERITDDEPETVASDIYTMGVIAAELASGQTLLDGTPPGEAVTMILGESGGIRTEIQQLGGLTREVRHLLTKLVHKDPADRPLTASQMGLEAKALASDLSGRSLSELAEIARSDAAPSRRWSPEEATAMSLDTLGLGTVDDDDDDDDTARIDPALMAPVPPMRTEPLYGPLDPAEETLEIAIDSVHEPAPGHHDWDEDVADDDSWTAESTGDDWSEEVPNKVSQYLDSGAFASPVRGLDETPADSDRSPRPPPDEVLRGDFTDPQGHQPQLPFDPEWELGTPLDAPEPSLVDADDDGPSFEHDPERLSTTIGGIETRRPTLSADDLDRARDDARREVDAEIDAALAAHRADEQRAEALLSGLDPVDESDERWEDEPAAMTLELFDPIPEAPQAPERFDAPLGQDAEAEDDVDVDLVDPPISVSLARESWKDGPHQMLLTAAKVDLRALRVLHDHDGLTSLSKHQAALLGYLADNPERELSNDELFHGAMLGEEGTPRSVPRIIARLRQKIERDPRDPDHLINGEHGGFVFLPGEIVPSGPPPLPEVGPLPGLENAVFDVTDALRKDPLVTVIGPPGVGASEVALRAAILLAEEGFEVHRAVVGGPESHVDRIARGLGIRRIGREPSEILDDVGRRLSAQEDLLIFLDAPKEMGSLRDDVHRIMRMHPRGVILVAGRHALELPGERTFRLRPLSVEKAVELFRQRVAFYRSGTRVPDELAAAVAEQLDRMPMALEAAARRTGFVAPEVLLQQLEAGQGLQDDSGGLEADIAALIDQCDPVERRVLEQLVVFSDGFELAAAEEVVDVADPGRGLNTVLDTLAARQILQRVSEEPARWALYAQAGAAVLRQSDDSSLIDAARERHARTFG